MSMLGQPPPDTQALGPLLNKISSSWAVGTPQLWKFSVAVQEIHDKPGCRDCAGPKVGKPIARRLGGPQGLGSKKVLARPPRSADSIY